MIKVSTTVDNVLKSWCSRNLGQIVPLDKFNPLTLEELKESRKDGKVRVYAHGSNNTVFNRDETKLYYRAWHDSMHIHFDLDFSRESELKIASLQAKELLKLGVTPWDAYVVMLDLKLHIEHYYLHKCHPEYQGDMIAHVIMQGENYTLPNFGYRSYL